MGCGIFGRTVDARAPPTCHDQLGCAIKRRSPWPHQPGTPSRVSTLDPLRPALAVGRSASLQFLATTQQRVSSPTARSPRREHAAVPATLTRHINRSLPVPADLCLSDRENPAPRMLLGGRCLCSDSRIYNHSGSKLLLKS